MLCKRCRKRQAERIYCRSCFLEIVKKRVNKHIRALNIKKHDRVLAIDPVSRYFLKDRAALTVISRPKSLFGIKKWDTSVYKNQNLQKYIKKHNIDWVMLPLTIDDKLSYYLNNMFAGLPEIPADDTLFITLPLTREELAQFVSYMNFRFKFNPPDDISIFLNKMEQRYKGSKFSFYNALCRLKKIS